MSDKMTASCCIYPAAKITKQTSTKAINLIEHNSNYIYTMYQKILFVIVSYLYFYKYELHENHMIKW